MLGAHTTDKPLRGVIALPAPRCGTESRPALSTGRPLCRSSPQLPPVSTRVSATGLTHTQIVLCCSGSLSLCDSNPRTHRRCIRRKPYVHRDLLAPIPPIAILPAPVVPQQGDPVHGHRDFQAL